MECSWRQITQVEAAVIRSAATPLRVAILDNGVQLDDPELATLLFRNPADPPGSSGSGCPGVCEVDDDSDGLADRADPEVQALIARFERACTDPASIPTACRRRPDGSYPRLDRLIELDDDENGLPDDYHGYDFYNESGCLLDPTRDSEPCRPEGPPNAHGTGVARAFTELDLGRGVELITVRVTEGSHGQIPETETAWRRAFEYAVAAGARIVVLAGGAMGDGLCPRLEPLLAADDPPLLITAAGNFGLDLDELDDAHRHWPGQCGYPATLLTGAAGWDLANPDPCPVRLYPGTMRGRSIDLIAPGVLDGGNFQQTSAAAAYAAAAAARLWLSDGFADCSALGIRRALREGSREIGEIRRGSAFADGRFLDLAGARAYGCP